MESSIAAIAAALKFVAWDRWKEQKQPLLRQYDEEHSVEKEIQLQEEDLPWEECHSAMDSDAGVTHCRDPQPVNSCYHKYR
jgi:hypothetical protein